MILSYFFVVCAAACWGSFLNMLAYRLMGGISFKEARSQCPACHTPLAWYDLIPILSYFNLRGACRTCRARISPLYPLIEIITIMACVVLISVVDTAYLVTAFIFSSALIVTIRTDLEHMLISRFASLYLIPFFVGAAWYGATPVSTYASIFGALSAYLTLYAVKQLHYILTGKIGMGQGDLELLALVGSYVGFEGWWITLLVSSLLGSIVGIVYASYMRTLRAPIPFGPFLALGAYTAALIITNHSAHLFLRQYFS